MNDQYYDVPAVSANFWRLPQKVSLNLTVKFPPSLKQDNRVVGLHVLSPNAGEITQGYAVAMRLGARKQDFDRTIGIHPTCSEVRFLGPFY